MLFRSAQRNFTLDDLLRPALQRLIEKTEDTCFISVRNGYNSICILREMGSCPIQIRSLPVGGCRPLGVGGLSLSILAALQDEEIEEILKKNMDQYLAYPGFTLDFLKEEVRKTRSTGYTFAQSHLINGVSCIAQVVHDPQNIPILSVGIVSVAARIEERRDMLVKAINDTCREMELLLKTTIKNMDDKLVGNYENHKLFI